jgi:malate/lactate dehydrogenase
VGSKVALTGEGDVGVAVALTVKAAALLVALPTLLVTTTA